MGRKKRVRRSGAAARRSPRRRAQVSPPHPQCARIRAHTPVPSHSPAGPDWPLIPEMDEEDYERRRSECLNEMLDLEKQFSELKEKLFRERLSQLRVRLEEVGAERAPEYTEPLGGLQRSLRIRIEVAGIYKGFCLDVIRNKYECELQGARQHLESEKLLLYDTLQGELQERIQRLEEDRQSLDISSEWWDDKLHARGSSKTWDTLPPSKRKKAPLVSGPYIVYMLQEIDILEDWTAIKKVGPLLHASPTLSQGRAWQCSSHRDSSFGLCRLSTWAFEGLGSSLLSPWCPLPSAQLFWHCCQLTNLLLPKAALEERTSSLCQPLSCSRAGVDEVGVGKKGRWESSWAGWASGRRPRQSFGKCFMLPAPVGAALAPQLLPQRR
uniref:BRMS1 transcriptional repressor and anoikis regulator n=1 Tax=Rhinolophus ferrumequinum TaxID=59479 RepID=A0A671DY35_RHIFE